MTARIRNVLLVLLGVAALVLKRHYAGPLAEIVRDYGGNVAASFAVYYVTKNTTAGWRYAKLLTAASALLVVEAFEAADGFGVMTNVYDPNDFAANALGVALALIVDALASRTAVTASGPGARTGASG